MSAITRSRWPKRTCWAFRSSAWSTPTTRPSASTMSFLATMTRAKPLRSTPAAWRMPFSRARTTRCTKSCKRLRTSPASSSKCRTSRTLPEPSLAFFDLPRGLFTAPLFNPGEEYGGNHRIHGRRTARQN
uniref:Uncharacterized protein n=1 Tax=mine drainage metagenome TaxID=410659 RepID=E6PS44_9ZZZZ